MSVGEYEPIMKGRRSACVKRGGEKNRCRPEERSDKPEGPELGQQGWGTVMGLSRKKKRDSKGRVRAARLSAERKEASLSAEFLRSTRSKTARPITGPGAQSPSNPTS